MAKTVGLMTTGFWHSFSRELFQGVSAECQRLGLTLVTLLGNELKSRSVMSELPELGNSLYQLVSRRRFDGLIVWTGNLGNYVTQEELEAFLDEFDLPLVTLGRKVGSYPNVLQDEEARSRKVMDHLVDHHGSRRILFFRGPQIHQGCELRYAGYRNSLESRGMKVDPALVTAPLRGWEDLNRHYLRYIDEPVQQVERAVSTPSAWLDAHPEDLDGLFLAHLAKHNLIPGRDFDAVLAATDILAAIAVRQLQLIGYVVPSDVRVMGLDGDIMVHDILGQTLSTMSLNLVEQGVAAVDLLMARLDGTSAPQWNFTPSTPDWGTTCGCLPAPFGTEGLSEEAENRLRLSLGGAEGQDRFFNLWVRETTLSPPKPGLDATRRLRFLWDLTPDLDADTLGKCEGWVQQAILETRSHTVHHNERRMKILFDIGQSLSSRFDRDAMAQALLTHLPRLGLASFSLALYHDPMKPAEGVEILAALSGGKHHSGSLDSRLMAPDTFFDAVAGRALVVEPLYFSGGLLGFLILEHNPDVDLEFYHHIGTQVSVGLKGSILKEEVTSNMAALNQAQVNLREKEKLAVLGGLAAGVVHEVNTPLGAIVSVNGVLESLTAGLVSRVAEAAPYLLPRLRSAMESFLENLPSGWMDEARSRPLRKRLRQTLAEAGVPEDEADEQARFLVEVGFDELPSAWLSLVNGAGGPKVFRLVEILSDIRRTAAINKQASSKMENYLKAIRSYIYRDRDHNSAGLVDVCQTVDTVLTLNSSKTKKTTIERRYTSRPMADGWTEALIQVWNNLVSNALFAMGDGGKLTVEVGTEGAWTKVVITDTGPGIPPDIQPSIFEDFFTTKPIGIGTGLGLGIVRQVVHDHHGTIGFESKPGRTAFTVMLPNPSLLP